MSDEQLFQQVTLLLQRNLTPEERRFLRLASESLCQEKRPQSKTVDAKAKVARVAV